MGDAKTKYRNGISSQNEAARNDAIIFESLAAGGKRKAQFGVNWDSVDINEVLDKFAPGVEPALSKGKQIWLNPNTNIAVVVDLGGNYLRIQDRNAASKSTEYLKVDGTPADFITLPTGKKRGVTVSERQRMTHFRIKKQEEMK